MAQWVITSPQERPGLIFAVDHNIRVALGGIRCHTLLSSGIGSSVIAGSNHHNKAVFLKCLLAARRMVRTSEMKSVTQLEINLTRIRIMSSSERLAIVQEESSIRHIECRKGDLPLLSEGLP